MTLPACGIRYPGGYDPNTVGVVEGRVAVVRPPGAGPRLVPSRGCRGNLHRLHGPGLVLGRTGRSRSGTAISVRVKGSKTMGADGNLYLVAQEITVDGAEKPDDPSRRSGKTGLVGVRPRRVRQARHASVRRTRLPPLRPWLRNRRLLRGIWPRRWLPLQRGVPQRSRRTTTGASPDGPNLPGDEIQGAVSAEGFRSAHGHGIARGETQPHAFPEPRRGGEHDPPLALAGHHEAHRPFGRCLEFDDRPRSPRRRC